MSKSHSDKTGLPAWFLIVAIGGVAGIVLGAVMFFGVGSPPAPKPTAAPAGAPPAAGATATASATPRKIVALTTLPTTLDGWKTEINAASAESYPALMDGAMRVTDPALRGPVMELLLVKWLGADRETYLQYLDQLESGADEGKAAWPVLVPAFVKALPQLGEEAASAPDLEEAVLWMTDYYAEQDPAAALEWARKWLLDDAQEAAMATIAGQLAKTSLEQAVAVARGLETPQSRVDAMANIGSELGKRDPQNALAWAQALEDPSEKAAAVEEVMWSMSEADPQTAAAQVKQINNPELLENVGGTIAEALAEKDPAVGIQWAESVPEGAARNEALVGALSGWARKDPRAAFAAFQEKYSGTVDAAEGLFEEWASSAPRDAAAEALKIADANLRETATGGVVYGWLNNGNDPQAVEQWVDGLPAGRDRDVASGVIVEALSVEEPQLAWDRALTIKDAEVRQEAVLSAFSGIAQNDAAAARTAMNSPSLSAEDRKLLEPVLQSVGIGTDPGGGAPASPN